MSAQFCPSCMNQSYEANGCVKCGFSRAQYRAAQMALPLDSVIGKYRIGVLKTNSRQSQIYTGIDTETSRPVLIEEFLPQRTSGRQPGNPMVQLAMNDAATQRRFQEACKIMQTSTQSRPLYKLGTVAANNTIYTVFDLMPKAPLDAQCEALADNPVYFRGNDGKPMMTINALVIPPMPAERAYNPKGSVVEKTVGHTAMVETAPAAAAPAMNAKPAKEKKLNKKVIKIVSIAAAGVLFIGGGVLIGVNVIGGKQPEPTFTPEVTVEATAPMTDLPSATPMSTPVQTTVEPTTEPTETPKPTARNDGQGPQGGGGRPLGNPQRTEPKPTEPATKAPSNEMPTPQNEAPNTNEATEGAKATPTPEVPTNPSEELPKPTEPTETSTDGNGNSDVPEALPTNGNGNGGVTEVQTDDVTEVLPTDENENSLGHEGNAQRGKKKSTSLTSLSDLADHISVLVVGEKVEAMYGANNERESFEKGTELYACIEKKSNRFFTAAKKNAPVYVYCTKKGEDTVYRLRVFDLNDFGAAEKDHFDKVQILLHAWDDVGEIVAGDAMTMKAGEWWTMHNSLTVNYVRTFELSLEETGEGDKLNVYIKTVNSESRNLYSVNKHSSANDLIVNMNSTNNNIRIPN